MNDSDSSTTLVGEIKRQLVSVHKYLDGRHQIGDYDSRAVHEYFGEIRQLEHLVQYAEKVLAKGWR